MMSKCISGPKHIEKLSEVLQVIAEPQRLKILCFLSDDERLASQGVYVSELAEHFQKSQNLMSHHLGILKRTDLLKSQREGKCIRYGINEEVYYQLKNALKLLFHFK